MSDLPSSRTAWRFLAIWGPLAILVFAAATFLTRVVTHVNRDDYDIAKTDVQEIGIFSEHIFSEHSDVSEVVSYFAYVRYSYAESTGDSRIFIVSPKASLWGRSTIILNHVKSCVSVSRFGDKEEPLKLFPLGGDFYSATITPNYVGDVADRYSSLQVVCELNSPPKKETFTARYLYFQNVDHRYLERLGIKLGEPNLRFGYPREWTLDASSLIDVDGITFAVAEGQLGMGMPSVPNFAQLTSARLLVVGDTVQLRWQSVLRASLRDELFVVIGAFIALGATMLLEAVRPFVESSVGGHRLDGKSSEHHSANRRTHTKTPHSS